MTARQAETAGRAEVCRLASPQEIEELLAVLEQIAQELHWQPGNQLRAPLLTAHHFAVRVSKELAGGLQVVLPDEAGTLPCQAVWPEVNLSGRWAHITILALRAEYRGRFGLFWPLCVEAWRFCVRESVDALILEAVPTMLARYRKLGWPLEVIGELRLHWGEPCYLCRMEMRSVAGSLLMRALRSPVYRTIVTQAARSMLETC